jgi:hypothetical protein
MTKSLTKKEKSNVFKKIDGFYVESGVSPKNSKNASI